MLRFRVLAQRISPRIRSLCGLSCTGALVAALALGGSADAEQGALAPPGASACVSGASGAAALACANVQRAANGIPPIIEDVPADATSWCPHEDDERLGVEDWRDTSTTHDWSATTSPWDKAPLHQQDIYNPMLQQAGDARARGQECWGSLPGAAEKQASTPAYYSFISDQGNGYAPASEKASEEPFAPQDLVGLKGATTGPNIIVYATGFPGETMWSAMNVTSWKVLSPAGQPVPDVQMVDSATAAEHGYEGYVDGDAAFIIPGRPLAPGNYSGTVAWQGPEGQTGTQQYSFTVRSSPRSRSR